jgi:Protein of unknown function (DUF3079)
MAKVPLHPKYPERVCWGCDKYCSADSLDCGNGTVRTQHPVEIFGEDWLDWSADSNAEKVHDPSELVQLNTSTMGV